MSDNVENPPPLDKLMGRESKGKVILLEGDLLSSDEKYIGHGSNCFNTMGKGIAKTIRDNYPEAYKVDLETKKGDKNKLGYYSTAVTTDDRYIFNLYTQYTYWDKKNMYRREYLESSLHKVLTEQPIPHIAIPAIGTGLANGSMEDLIYACLKVAKETGKDIRIYFLIS